MVASVDAFADYIKADLAQVAVQADSEAALRAALTLASSGALMNALAAELALRLEALDAGLVIVQHIPGEFNFIADALTSLPSEG